MMVHSYTRYSAKQVGVLMVSTILAATLALAACTPPAPAPAQAPVPLPTNTSGQTVDFATGLLAPWSMAPLPDGSLLLSQRDTGIILELSPSGSEHVIGTVPGVVHSGEGGLLGLATGPGCVSPAEAALQCVDLYAYLSTATENRIVRIPATGAAGARGLGVASTVLQGIPKAANHNGGRIAFGPDGMLYATTGDAGNRSSAQDLASTSGKILRLMPDGGIPADNPFPASPVYSLGHRNPQGIAWDSRGRMWASEFGQDTWDELNEIVSGTNYGWPLVEGMGSKPGFKDPELVWPTDQASPSGIAIKGTTLFMAALRGERLWVVDLAGKPAAHAALTGKHGRLRDVTSTPNGRLYVLTNNTDGRGNPNRGDDRIVEFTP